MGDFVGHPFRGNQWTHGRSVAEGGGSAGNLRQGDYRDGHAPTPDDDPTGTFSRRGAEELAGTESNIQRNDFETARIFDVNGKSVLIQQGDRDSVRFSVLQGIAMRGGVLTHNHPSSGPPSFEDMALFFKQTLREIRAVAKNGTLYRVGRKAGNMDSVAVADAFNRVASVSMARTRANIIRGLITADEANANWVNEMHEILLAFVREPEAVAAGIYYKRTRRG